MKQKDSLINIKKMTVFISVFLAFVICLSVIYAYAEYTKSSRAKRVIATYGSVGMLFSSNRLESDSNLTDANFSSYTSISNLSSILTGSADSPAAIDINICNFAQGNAGKHNDTDLEYTLYARLIKIDENNLSAPVSAPTAADFTGNDLSVTLVYKGETVTLNNSTFSHTFNPSVLSHTAANTDACTVSFSTDFNDPEKNNNIRLFLAAIPSASGLFSLSSMLGTAIRTGQAERAWEGYFNEVGAFNPTNGTLTQPMDLDGFNYVLTGTGVGTVTLSWQSDKVAINQVFLKSFAPSLTPTATTANGVNWSSISIPVNSDTVNRYDTQFYFVDKNSTDFANWTQVNSYVTCVYTPQTTP